jgi:hypothetical protein
MVGSLLPGAGLRESLKEGYHLRKILLSRFVSTVAREGEMELELDRAPEHGLAPSHCRCPLRRLGTRVWDHRHQYEPDGETARVRKGPWWILIHRVLFGSLHLTWTPTVADSVPQWPLSHLVNQVLISVDLLPKLSTVFVAV